MTEQFPPPNHGASPSADDRNLAMLMHVITLVVLLTGGWLLNVLVPLVGMIWRREDEFLAEHSREQLNFQISLIIYAIITAVVLVLTLGLALLVVIPVGIVVALVILWVMVRAALAASRGEQYRFPLTIRLVR